MHALWVDFGEVSDDDLLAAFIPPDGLELGETVLIYDGEGNTSRGTVERIGDRLAFVRPDWRTWSTWEPRWATTGTPTYTIGAAYVPTEITYCAP